jgi:hypothetical protein
MITKTPIYNWDVAVFPAGLSKNWFEIYGNCIFSGVFVSSFMPYAAPMIGIILKKCGNKTLKPSGFDMDRKYANMLTTMFVAFAYGFAIPLLFFAAGISFLVQFFLDKILVTYWHQFIPVKSD